MDCRELFKDSIQMNCGARKQSHAAIRLGSQTLIPLRQIVFVPSP
jgi:hypothetical protein